MDEIAIEQTPTATRHTGPVQYTSPLGGIGEVVLWECSDGEYVLTSAIDTSSARETLAFASDEEGTIVSYTELSAADFGEHDRAMEKAGYRVG